MTKINRPRYWYYPSNDPKRVIRCEWNDVDMRYNKNCVSVLKSNLPANLRAALTRLTNATDNHDFSGDGVPD